MKTADGTMRTPPRGGAGYVTKFSLFPHSMFCVGFYHSFTRRVAV